jgi:ribosomal protein L22
MFLKATQEVVPKKKKKPSIIHKHLTNVMVFMEDKNKLVNNLLESIIENKISAPVV